MLLYCPNCKENVEVGEKMVSPQGEEPAEYEPCCSICGSTDLRELWIEEEDEEDC